MLFLSFDTSGREITVALFEGGQTGRIVAAERIDFAELAVDDPRLPLSGIAPEKPAKFGTNSGAGKGNMVSLKKVNRQESVSLLIPTIDRMLQEQGLTKFDIGAIAVGIGPGGFTGIRVAITTARTLAQALKLPLVGLNSLEVACFSLLENDAEKNSSRLYGVIKEASRSHCYLAVYKPEPVGDNFDLVAVQEPIYLTYELLPEKLNLASFWHVDSAVLAKMPQSSNGDFRAEVTPPVNNIASLQAKMAWLRVSLGESAFHYRLTEPLYLRGASVTLKKGDGVEKVESN